MNETEYPSYTIADEFVKYSGVIPKCGECLVDAFVIGKYSINLPKMLMNVNLVTFLLRKGYLTDD